MSEFTWKEATGGLFANKNRKDGSKQPNMNGFFTLDGKVYSIAGWTALTKSGDKYLKLKVEEKQ